MLGLGLGLWLGLGFIPSSPIIRELVLSLTRLSFPLFLVSFMFCLSGVFRWAKISLAHFSGRI